MGQILFWLEAAVASALFVALMTALVVRMRTRRRRWGAGVAAGIVAALPWLAAIGVFTLIYARVGGVGFVLAASVVNGAMFAAAAVILIRRGLRRPGESDVRQAATWPRGKLALVWAAAVFVTCMTFWNLDLAVRQDMAVVRAEAGAIAQSVAPPRAPDSQNAALVYRKAWRILDSQSADGQPWDVRVRQWFRPAEGEFDPTDPEMIAFVEANEAVMDMIRLDRVGYACDFATVYVPVSVTNVPMYFGKMKALAVLACLSARVEAHRGRVGPALANLSACFRLAEDAMSDPSLLNCLVGVAINSLGCRTLEDVLEQAPLEKRDLQWLQLNPMLDFNAAHHRAMRMEEAYGLTIFTMPWAPGLETSRVSLSSVQTPAYRVFMWRNDIAVYRQWIHEIQRLSAMPYYRARDGWREASDKLSRRGLGGFLTGILSPAMTRSGSLIAISDAQHRLAVLAEAMMRYRLREGAFPEAFQPLLESGALDNVPVDPFTGEAIKLIRTDGDNAVIYSVGPDLDDDRGEEFDHGTRAGDITFKLSFRPPQTDAL